MHYLKLTDIIYKKEELPIYEKLVEGKIFSIGGLGECELLDDFNKLLTTHLTEYAKAYPWFTSLGTTWDVGIKHVVVSIDDLAASEPFSEVQGIGNIYMIPPSLCVILDNFEYEVLYMCSSNKDVSLVFPGASIRNLEIKEGGLVIYPSCHAYMPMLSIRDGAETKDINVQFLHTSLTGKNNDNQSQKT